MLKDATAQQVRSSAEISAFAYILDAVLVWWLYHPKHVAGAEMCANLESVYSFLHLSWDSFINNRIDQLLRGMALLLLFSKTYVDVERLRFWNLNDSFLFFSKSCWWCGWFFTFHICIGYFLLHWKMRHASIYLQALLVTDWLVALSLFFPSIFTFLARLHLPYLLCYTTYFCKKRIKIFTFFWI